MFCIVWRFLSRKSRCSLDVFHLIIYICAREGYFFRLCSSLTSWLYCSSSVW